MAELPADQRDAAAAAFRFLVTSSGRKIALSSEELREFSEADAAPLEPALEHLERERILRPVPSSEPGGVARHEIYHDVLAPAILEWRRRHVEEQRSAETEQRWRRLRERARRLEVRNRRLAAAVIALAAVASRSRSTCGIHDRCSGSSCGRSTPGSPCGVRARPTRGSSSSPWTTRRWQRLDDPNGTRRPPAGPSYARLLNRLRQDRPAVIALDVIFDRRAGPLEAIAALLAAMRATRDRLVLAYQDFAVVQRIDGTPGGSRQPPRTADAVRRTGAQDGLRRAAAGRGRQQPARRLPGRPAVPDATGTDESTTANLSVPTFAFAAADLARGGALSRRVDDLPTASRRASGGQSQRTTWIDYRGPPGTVRRVSALDVLEGRVRARRVPRQDRRDRRHHPCKPRRAPDAPGRGRGMPGVEVQANAIDTMLRGEPLRDASSLINILAIILLACLPAVAA